MTTNLKLDTTNINHHSNWCTQKERYEAQWELKDKNIEHTIQWEIIKKFSHIHQKNREHTLFGRKISNFDQSSFPEQKKTFPAIKRKHKPSAITHSHLKRAAQARISGVKSS